MKQRYKALIALFAAMALALSGCQLALPDEGEGNDRLIGVFITREYLDLFDIEGYVADNSSRLHFSGGETIMDGPARAYEGKIYAALTTKKQTSGTGEVSEYDEYVFEDIEGIPYFSATMPMKDGFDSYASSSVGEEISDKKMSVNVGDNEEGTTLEGTIYVAADAWYHSFFANPVYQSADGRVYLMAGTGFSGALTEGGAFTQTLEETIDIAENGITTKKSTSIKLEIRGMAPPERIVMLQMDESGSLLSREEYVPGTLPEELQPHGDAAYLIVETHSGDAVSREIVDKSAEGFDTFYARADGICVKAHTRLIANGP